MGNQLYVGNLSFNMGSDARRDAFAKFDELTDMHLVTDRQTGQARGFGFVTMGVTMETSIAARAALAAMNGSTLDGRTLRPNEAEERQGGGGRADGGVGGGGSRGGFGGAGKRERW